MANKKLTKTICTYCGKRIAESERSDDDPIPKTLWKGKGKMKGRAPKAASCKKCNNHSREALLKYFLTAFSTEYHAETLAHFKHPKGRKDFREFRTIWRDVDGVLYLFADRKVTAKLRKMFRGLRRYMLKKTWFYVRASSFYLFQVHKVGDHYLTRPLPLRVKGKNPPSVIHPDYYAMLNEPFQYSFGQFHFDLIANDNDGVIMAFMYVPEPNVQVGNHLYLVCYVPRPHLEEDLKQAYTKLK